MPTIREVLIGHVLPGAICLIGLVIVAWRGMGKHQWAAPIVISTAFTIGYYLLRPVRSFPPQDQSGWLVFLTPALAIIAALDSASSIGIGSRALGVLLCAIGYTFLLLVPIPSSRPVDWIAIGGVAVVIWIVWLSLVQVNLRRGAPEMSLMVTVIALFTAAILGMSGSAIFGLQGGTLVAVMVSTLIVACVLPRFAIDRGMIFLFVFLWLGLLINGRFWSDVSLFHAVLLVSAAFVIWIGELPWCRNRGFLRVVLRIAIVSIPLLIAGITAGIQFQKDMQDLGY